MQRSFLKIGAMFGAIAVLLGAFGTHLLKTMVDPDIFSAFQTAVYYHIFHAIALLIVGILYKRYPNKLISWSGRLFFIGILLFSGSLYVLAFSKATNGAGLGNFGLITPVGGVCFVAGWLCLFLGVPSKLPS
jgi:uncharacterized membrane protein YgdD (TMEM256/DUF423 family)